MVDKTVNEMMDLRKKKRRSKKSIEDSYIGNIQRIKSITSHISPTKQLPKIRVDVGPRFVHFTSKPINDSHSHIPAQLTIEIIIIQWK